MALTDNLLARWILDEGSGTSAADETGTHNGTLDVESWTTDGTYGDVYVTAATQQIDCGTTQFNGGSNLSAFSIAFWIWLPNTSLATIFASAQTVMLSRYRTTGDQRGFRIYSASSGVLGFATSSDGTSTTLEVVDDLNYFEAGDLNTWVHVGFTTSFSGGSTVFYKNAADTGDTSEFSTVASMFDSNTGLVIANQWTGSAGGGSQGPVGARMREVAIWSRQISAQEVTDHMNGTWASTIAPLASSYYRMLRNR